MIYDMEQAGKEGLERFSSSSFPITFGFIMSMTDDPSVKTMYLTFAHHFWRKTIENPSWLLPEMVSFFVYYTTNRLSDLPASCSDMALEILKTFAAEIYEKRKDVVIPSPWMPEETFSNLCIEYAEELMMEAVAVSNMVYVNMSDAAWLITLSVSDQLCYETGHMMTEEQQMIIFDEVEYFLLESYKEEGNYEDGI